MKMHFGKKRQAISPVIATVILIAITLVAAIAIGGFVFGLFGSFSSTAQVTATAVSIPSSTTSGPSLAAACATSVSAGQTFVAFTNSGTGSTTLTGFSITYGGNTYSQIIATCTVSAAGSTVVGSPVSAPTVYVVITALPGTVTKGVAFVGAATLGNGGQVSYTGVFS